MLGGGSFTPGEIRPPAGGPARYTLREMPPYRYVPGLHPHPVAHPSGHSYHSAGLHPAAGRLPAPDRWRESEDYLYGADLYNSGYWWEAHEAWEGLWQQTQKAGMQGHFLQGLIQVSAAHLKRHMGHEEGMQRLLARAMKHLQVTLSQPVGDEFMGLDVAGFVEQVRRHFDGSGGYPFVRLNLPDEARSTNAAAPATGRGEA